MSFDLLGVRSCVARLWVHCTRVLLFPFQVVQWKMH